VPAPPNAPQRRNELADEQAVLRRVATLVARGVPADELFATVAAEVGMLLGTDLAGMTRFVTEATIEAVATWAADDAHPDAGGVWSTEGEPLSPKLLRTGRPAREDDWSRYDGPIPQFIHRVLGVRSSVGSPIVVEGAVWGALFVHSRGDAALPPATEARLENFTELIATAIANAQARSDLARLADEQAALRRVATLVARESPPTDVLAAVAEEVRGLLGVELTQIYRYEGDDAATAVAAVGEDEAVIPVGARVDLGGDNIGSLVHRTERPVRIDDYATATGALGVRAHKLGLRSGVGAPIVVAGRVWGVVIAMTRRPQPVEVGAEARIGHFTELVATAISNVQARTDLAASRARIVAAADDERRRVVRDLHDGAQQRLVHTTFTLRMAREALEGQDRAAALLDEALDDVERATDELRELAQGILPAVLTHGGLRAAAEALGRRTPATVEMDVTSERLAPAVEATAYFVVAESLTNVAKHARAHLARVTARVEGGALRIVVRDDGVGGARPAGGGLVGLADRLAALGGELRVESPVGGGTLVAADIPLG
jgi:signal transduction histidine kinase